MFHSLLETQVSVSYCSCTVHRLSLVLWVLKVFLVCVEKSSLEPEVVARLPARHHYTFMSSNKKVLNWSQQLVAVTWYCNLSDPRTDPA